jgi:hypothetical protein
MARSRFSVPGIDAELLTRDAANLLPEPTRRRFLHGAASLGALAFLTGCDIVDGPSAEKALRVVSGFNDRVQAWLFDPNRPRRPIRKRDHASVPVQCLLQRRRGAGRR